VSLKGLAFNYYVEHSSASIDSWGQMEKEFVNRFYSISELTNTKECDKESFIDYINP